MANTRMTIKGIARWPKLTNPDTYNGQIIGWTIQVEPAEGEYDRLMKEFSEQLAMAKTDKEFDGKQWLEHPNIGIVENKDGTKCFKFKKIYEFRDKKTGELVRTNVPIYDKHGVPCEVEIGNGSEIIVAFSPRPYHMNKNNNGLSLRLDAVQVLNLKSRAMGAEYFGFQVDDEDEQSGISENPFA